ncbi:MAG: prepilin-type N-terminal cleavage/methylation domain-containing protein [Clostridia bacterium]|nr:prepilin-type N-terminal cleavage/methylation domain-containing protein [Clostridia bacterium]
MKKLRFLLRLKKGFTLVELIAVMAIMAIATSIVLPNIRGMISKKEESQYRNFCDEAVTYVKSYTSLLTLGEEYVPYEKDGKTLQYDITTTSGLTKALNEYNLESNYQYYVLAFEDSSTTSNPTNTIKDLISNKKLAKNDVMITVILPQDKGGRVPRYVLQGFWYYVYASERIVYTYYVPGGRRAMGFSKLTSNGK